MTVHIPEGTEIHKFLQNNGKVAHWELLNELVKLIPKTVAEREFKIIEGAINELVLLEPELKTKFDYLRPLLYQQILCIDRGDEGVRKNKRVQLDDYYYEELKKL